jgi:hypothetical protein
VYIYASKYIFFMYYIKNTPETLPLPEIFENMRFPLPLPLPEIFENMRFPLPLPLHAPNSLGLDH